MSKKNFEIFFKDLKLEAQDELLKEFNTTEEEENWDIFPLAILCKDTPTKEEDV